MNAIETEALTKRYQGPPVVDQLDWALPVGSACALLGPNGAGKTTTLQMLLGFTPPTSGTCRVLGAEPWDLAPEVRARIGFVSEEPILPGWLRVRDLVAYHASLYPRWGRERADELLALFRLDSRQKVEALSKGQNRRLMLLLAFAQGADLLVLDEPGSGLDVQARRHLLELLADYLAEGDRTLLLSTHLVTDVERIASDVAVLAGGRLRAFAPLDDLYEHVKTLRIPFELYERTRERWRAADPLSSERVGDAQVLVVRSFQSQPLHVLRELSGGDVQVVNGDRSDTYLASTGDAIEVLHMPLEDVYLALSNGSARAEEGAAA